MPRTGTAKTSSPAWTSAKPLFFSVLFCCVFSSFLVLWYVFGVFPVCSKGTDD